MINDHRSNSTKVSVLITYYNQENCVDDSINSVLAIDFPCEYEILIGDDGSSDKTLEKVRAFQERHPTVIKYFVMPRDQNITYEPIYRASANRLNLLRNASGDYVLFLDGDDFYCDKEFVKQALEQFKIQNNIIACAFNFQYYYPKENKLQIGCLHKQGFLNSTEYVKHNYTHSGAIVFKNVFTAEHIKRLEQSNVFDDNLITVFALQYGELFCFDRVVYTYQQFANSSWNDRTDAERFLINAMDFQIISSAAPKFRKELAKRQWGAIRSVYKLRPNFQQLLGNDRYKTYVEQTQANKDAFIAALLKWNQISLWNKLKVVIKYHMIKWRLGLEFF